MKIVFAACLACGVVFSIVGCSGGSDAPELHTPPAGLGPKNPNGGAQVPAIAHKKEKKP